MTHFEGHLDDVQAQCLVDGSLTPAEAAELDLHVSGCAGCRASVETYRLLSSALEDLAIPMPPGDFTGGVLARIDERERIAAREHRHAIAIFAGVVAAAVGAFALAGPGAWAPVVSSLAEGLGSAARALQIGESFVPTLVGALRMQILLVAAFAAMPLLLLLSRLVPAPRAETA